ncbi:MAG TPA: BON domain-containing protein [Blastocatellia bacterium]|nr:BON domain-containing protein [Blastocatellia bacterium]
MKMIKGKLTALATALAIAAVASVAIPVASAQQGDDALTMKQIRKKLVTLPFYGVFDNLGYKFEGDTVTLYGQVVRSSTRKDAERRVAKIEGVERVINNIEVLPVSGFDDSIRVRAFRAIFRTGGLFRYSLGANPSIHIIVNRGHVTLEGVVASKMDSQLAYMAANQVFGVFSVTNNLRVERGS